jgi:hypothetical protein
VRRRTVGVASALVAGCTVIAGTTSGMAAAGVAAGAATGAPGTRTAVGAAERPAAVAAARRTASRACSLPKFGPGRRYRPRLTGLGLSPHVTNPYFPLRPGTVLLYSGTKDGKPAVDVVLVTNRTRRVDGVRTRIVADRLYLSGRLVERTSDYYAQDRCGNVWYFGEDTADLDARGRVVSREGSFHAGVRGAQPGVVMQNRPQLGRTFRQEWYHGHAEDVFTAVRPHVKVRVPAGSYRNALETRETTALEPGVVDAKYYVRGLGVVAEVTRRGPREELRLVGVVR